MLDSILLFNFIVVTLMTLAYAYQTFFIAAGLYFKIKNKNKHTQESKDLKQYKYAAIISARNEENVIGQLIGSLKKQNYPSDLFDIYVIADNCTDNTGLAAKRAGANVLYRYDEEKKGKGYALDYFFHELEKRYDEIPYEGYFVFDADNIVDPNFVMEMNKVHNEGYDAITSYRNSKNCDENWIAAGYSVWFLKEARFLNSPRYEFKTTCAISGTGFFVSQKLINKNGGWPYHLLTEDIEFSVNCAINEELIGYADKAIVYDEQPTTFKQSWDQRLRWSKGFYQINLKYTIDLIKSVFTNKKHKFSAYDLLMTTAPSMLLTLTAVVVNLGVLIYCLYKPSYMNIKTVEITLDYLICALVNFYISMYACGFITVILEWKNIKTSAFNKIKYTFTFPLFMLTYIPIALVALFKKVEWKQINHFATNKQII